MRSHRTANNGRLRRLALLGTALAASLAMLFSIASSASALSLGLQWTGDYNAAAPEMDQVGKTGATLFRYPINPEHSGNGANWEFYDAVFASAAEHGVTILPQLSGRLNGAIGLPSAGEKAGWTEWVKQAVRRYGYNGVFWSTHPGIPARPVFAWETWNEPNNASFGTITAAEYGSFLAWAGPAIQGASESWGGAKTGVLFGGLLAWSGGTGYQNYLKTAYQVPGASGAITGVAFHPYELDTSQFPGQTRIQAFEKAVNGLRTYLNSLGGSGKTLWITETGWPAEAEYGVGDAEQANLLTASINWAKANAAGLNLQAFIWYNYRDIAVGTWQYRSGLRRLDGSYRPSWWAFEEETGAPEWPKSGWYTDNIGGNISSDPDIASWEPGRLDVFAKSGTSTLKHTFFPLANGWAPWESLEGSLSSGPGAVSWGPNRVDVVGRAANNSIEHWYWTGSTWGRDNLGGSMASDPDISSWGPERLDVFVRGTDNALWHKFWVGGVGWYPWESLGGTLTSGPGAVSWGPNRIDVVARGTDNSVEHWYWTGSVWGHDNLGGTITSDPDISSWGPGRLDVFARGAENALWHKYWVDGPGWQPWEYMGGSLASGPSAVAWGFNRIDVVARAADNTVNHWFYVGYR
jgi:hypothetical protein